METRTREEKQKHEWIPPSGLFFLFHSSHLGEDEHLLSQGSQDTAALLTGRKRQREAGVTFFSSLPSESTWNTSALVASISWKGSLWFQVYSAHSTTCPGSAPAIMFLNNIRLFLAIDDDGFLPIGVWEKLLIIRSDRKTELETKIFSNAEAGYTVGVEGSWDKSRLWFVLRVEPKHTVNSTLMESNSNYSVLKVPTAVGKANAAFRFLSAPMCDQTIKYLIEELKSFANLMHE